jgi:integrase
MPGHGRPCAKECAVDRLAFIADLLRAGLLPAAAADMLAEARRGMTKRTLDTVGAGSVPCESSPGAELVEPIANTGPLDWLAGLTRPAAGPVSITVHVHIGGALEAGPALCSSREDGGARIPLVVPEPRAAAEPSAGPGTEAPPAVEPYIRGWVNDKKRRGHRDVRRAEALLRAVVAACAWTDISRAGPADLMAELARRAESGDKSRTINKLLSTTSSFIGWCSRAYPDKVPLNWVKSIARSEEDDATEGRRFLTPDELGRLLRWAGGLGLERHAFYATLAGTGMRLGEAAGLERGQVVLEGVPRIELTRATKSRKSRVIPLAADLAAILRPRCAGAPDGRVFSERPTLRTLAADCERAGVDPAGVGFHSFRKTYASGLALKGVPLSVAQKVLGHSDPKLTAGIYQKFQHAELAEALGVTNLTPLSQVSAGSDRLDKAQAETVTLGAVSVEMDPESSMAPAALQSNDPMSGPVPLVQRSSGNTLTATGGAGPASARALGSKKAASRDRTGDPRFTNAHAAGRTGHSLRFGEGDASRGRRSVPRVGEGAGGVDLRLLVTGAAGGNPEHLAALFRAIADMLAPDGGER